VRVIDLIAGLLPGLFKKVAEGDKGNPITKLYWFLAGKKTVTALIIAILYGVAQVALHTFGQCAPECASPEALKQFASFIAYVPEVVATLIVIGLYDKAVRLDPPKKN